jgi:hypothetical protein
VARKVELTLTPSSAESSVLLDGEPVKGCRAVRIEARVGEPTVATFELVDVEVFVKADVEDEYARLVDVTTLQEGKRVRLLVKEPA